MREVLFRASSFGLLMTEPRSKAEGPLSVGAKTAIRNMVAQDILGIDFEVSDKKLEKGHLVEADSSAMFNRVFGRSVVKNTERRFDAFFSGECDHFDDEEVTDIKSAWSAATWPIAAEDVASAQRSLYEFQGRVYMRLWNRPRFRIAYCLVDTPTELLGAYEPLPMHIVSHIPEHMRITSWVIERDAAIEALMVEKARQARAYYHEVVRNFDATHRPLAAAAVVRAAAAPWSEPAAEPAPAGTAPSALVADPFSA